MKYIIVILVLLFPYSTYATQNTTPPIPRVGRWELFLGMTKDQFIKATGKQLKDNGYVEESTLYGYPATVGIVFDSNGRLSKIQFTIWQKNESDALIALNKIHGGLVANLGAPSADGINEKHTDGYNTIWCSTEWTVFLAPFVKFEQSVPTGIMVSYFHENACQKH